MKAGDVPIAYQSSESEINQLNSRASRNILSENLDAFFVYIYRKAGFDAVPAETADLLNNQGHLTL